MRQLCDRVEAAGGHITDDEGDAAAPSLLITDGVGASDVAGLRGATLHLQLAPAAAWTSEDVVAAAAFALLAVVLLSILFKPRA